MLVKLTFFYDITFSSKQVKTRDKMSNGIWHMAVTTFSDFESALFLFSLLTVFDVCH